MQELGRLTRRQRAGVLMRYIEDRTEADTPRLTGCSDARSSSHPWVTPRLRGDVP